MSRLALKLIIGKCDIHQVRTYINMTPLFGKIAAKTKMASKKKEEAIKDVIVQLFKESKKKGEIAMFLRTKLFYSVQVLYPEKSICPC